MTERPGFRFAHISDLHFSKITWNPSQLFSKRWLGTLNLVCARKHTFAPERLTSLISLFHEHHVDAVLITGDLTSTSHEKEFHLAHQFVESLRREKFKVFAIPGNHDHYTRQAYKNKLFYRFFETTYGVDANPTPPLSLQEDGLTTTYFGHRLWLFALDTALATPLLSSQGHFSSELEQKLEKALNALPSDHQVILMNHFPFFATESHRKSLLRREALRKILERHPKIKLFLHGHTHRHCIADLRSSSLPIILDSGSTAQKNGGTWNLVDVTPHGCEVDVFKNFPSNEEVRWKSTLKRAFTWE